MSDITLEQLQSAQNEYIAAQTAKINSLETNNAAALTALSELAQRVYGYTHSAMVTSSLDAVYNALIAEEPALENVSAVGFTALLKDGDSIPAQENILFVNGTEEENGYTFSGENSENGIELVNVWYFEKENAFDALLPVSFDVIDLKIFQKNAVVAVDSSYDAFAAFAEYDGYTNPRTFNGKALTENGIYTRGGANASKLLKCYFSDAVHIYRNFTGLSGNVNLKEVNLPECIYFGAVSTTNPTDNGTDNRNSMLIGCTNPELTVKFPKLLYLIGSFGNYDAIFKGVWSVTVPESCKYIAKTCFDNNYKIQLECKDAIQISDVWCKTAPTIFEMADDWGASINIAVAASNWAKEDFVDLFENKLRDMGDDVREIKIPSAIYDSLTDEEFAFAEDKGWTVGA